MSAVNNPNPDPAKEPKNNGQGIKKKGNSKTAKQLMSDHVQDENDKITDEEFENIDLGIDANTDTAHHPLEIKNDPDRPKDEEKDHNVTTPWDVIK